MAGLLDLLMPNRAQQPDPWSGLRQAGQPSGGGFLGTLLSPEIALPMAAQLMGQQGNSANFGNALGAAGPAFAQRAQTRQESEQKNRTLEYLRTNAPELADAVANGLPMGSAWTSYLDSRKAQKSGLINAGDGNIYNPDTKEWVTAPNGRQKAPQVVELFDEATGQPFKATWNAETGTYDRVGGVKARSGMTLRTNPDGSVELVQGDIAGAMPKLTEAEGRNAGFYGRAAKSHGLLSNLEGQGQSFWNKLMQAAPLGTGNYGLSDEAQQFVQAKRDFINAVLRRESGAVISEPEFANAEQQYFPQPGDSPAVIEQKRQNRETTIRGLEISAGQGAPFATQPPSSVAAPSGNTRRTSGGVQWSVEP